ncbi:MAG: hypothetical protein ACREBA_08475 [Nitrosotalea sp.]
MVNKIHDYLDLQDFAIKTLQHQHADQDNKISPYTQSTLLEVINKHQLRKKQPIIDTRQLLDYVINPLLRHQILEYEKSTKTYNLSKDYLSLISKYKIETVDEYVLTLRIILNTIGIASINDWLSQKTANKQNQKSYRQTYLQAQDDFTKILDVVLNTNHHILPDVIYEFGEHLVNETKHLLKSVKNKKTNPTNSASSTPPKSQK